MTRTLRIVTEQPVLAHGYEYPARGVTAMDAARMAVEEHERHGRHTGRVFVQLIPNPQQSWRVFVDTED